jgi:uncharacterized protein (TIGR02678 family)
VTVDPHREHELRAAARALLVGPWRTAESDGDLFRLIRRHADTLDRWFTQRLGYRLMVASDTARLVKSGAVPADRPLLTTTERPFTPQEYTALALVLAATAAGPDRISLRDLVLRVRSAAADAGVVLVESGGQRRTLVTVLRWLIDRGVLRELDRSVTGYESDGDADALLEVRNDRLAMLAAPALSGAKDADELFDRAATDAGGRAALRRRLTEDPVVHADTLEAGDWAELRRRFGEEARFAEEMFGLRLEGRAEGVALIDVEGGCSDVAFPAAGTTAHAALLLLGALTERHRDGADGESVRAELAALLDAYGTYWRKDAVAAPERLLAEVVALLRAMQLVEPDGAGRLVARPVAARYEPEVTLPRADAEAVQESLL